MGDILQIMPVTKVKRGLLDILKVMQEEGSTITMTRNGEAVGVMMTPDRYASLLETIEILADHKIMTALAASAKDFSAGRVVTDAEVWDR
ncbi:MAG: type II toxin-antitoxin system Phd/YefM family antitoxin [Desulfobacterales bacterium]|nr:type II toxin-antitoxin system Phd/YefM family antitoxin [Desulfobacterales bacterium]